MKATCLLFCLTQFLLNQTLPLEAAPAVLSGPVTNPANGHVYYLLESDTWTASEAKAQDLGGHLTTINDSAEDAWVFSTFGNFGGSPKGLWIGLTDAAQEGTFVWVDGDPSAYRNFAIGEPNNFNNEDYGFIFPPQDTRASTWNDYPAESTLATFAGPNYPNSFPLHGVVEVIPPTACAPPPTGLISWWRGEGDANDSVGGNSGVLSNGVGFVAGKVGQAFDFSGASDFVVIPDSPLWAFGTNEFTIELWTRFNSATAFQIFVANDEGGGAQKKWIFWVRNGNLQFHVGGPGLGDNQIASQAFSPVVGQYYHLAVTRSGTNYKIYVDGAQFSTGTYAGEIPDAAAPLTLGGSATEGIYSDVQLDEVSIYSRALSASEIQAIHDAGTEGKCTTTPSTCTAQPSGLISWWRGESNGNDYTGANPGDVKSGVSFAHGKVGQAFVLDGTSSSYIEIPTTNGLNFTGNTPMSVEFWAYRTGIATVSGILHFLGKRAPGCGSFQYQVASDPTDGVQFGASGGHAGTGVVMPLNEWVHVAGTYDGTTFRIYTNGVLGGSFVGSLGPQNNGKLLLGNSSTECERFVGLLDEVAIYNRALSGSEILSIYGAGSEGKCTTPEAPTITQQPQDQSVLVGDAASFIVTANGTQPLGYQWYFGATLLTSETNPTLSLVNVQLTDAGVYSVVVSNAFGVTNSSTANLAVNELTCTSPPAGLISWWRGEGDANDSVGGNSGVLSNGVGFVAGKVGQAFDFSGANDFVVIPDSPLWAFGTNEFTIELWARFNSAAAYHVFVANDEGAGAQKKWLFWVRNGSLQFHVSGPGLGDNQIASQAFSPVVGQYYHLAVTRSGTNYKIYVDGAQFSTGTYAGAIPDAAAPLTLGGSATEGIYSDVQLDEVSIYSRALSASEIQAIHDASSQGKCVVGVAPVISQQPQNRSVLAGNSANFSVTAGGTAPLFYQWFFETTALAGQTNPALNLANVQLADAGDYWVSVTNGIGAATSSVATLTVTLPPARVQVTSVNANAGNPVSVPVVLVANGNEAAVGFSLEFDPALLGYSSISLGSGAPGGSLLVNSSQAASGRVGVAVSLPSGNTFSMGTQQVVTIDFNIALVTNNTASIITLSDTPVVREVADGLGNPLSSEFAAGTVTIAAADFEGDVTPRPTGNHSLTVADWVQVGRFVAKLDTPSTTGEFQRADTAPRNNLGNGNLTATDWVQAGRYVAGLDPITGAGGPTGDGGRSETPASKISEAVGGRELRVVTTNLIAGQIGTAHIDLVASGDESALTFSLSFDASQMSFTGATLGTGAAGGTLNVNTAQAGTGKIGIGLAMPIGTTLNAGTQQVVLANFNLLQSASGDYPLSFTSDPVAQEVSDALANELTTSYTDGLLQVEGPIPTLVITLDGDSVILTWPADTTGYSVEDSPTMLVPSAWNAVGGPPSVIGGSNIVVLPATNEVRFFRLKK